LFALEVTPDVLKEASRKKIDTLVTHHPLIFQPLSNINENVAVHHLVAEMIRRRISMIAAHTNLDASPYGTNPLIADKLKLKTDGPIFPASPGEKEWGLGRLAKLDEPTTLAMMAKKLKRALGCQTVQIIGNPNRKIRRVAICTGAGTSVIRQLPPGGADLLITGEINYHGAVDAEVVGLSVLCAGHYETEAPAMEYLARLVGEDEELRRSGIKISTSLKQSSPIKVV
jgi:dinuclear metal center YbgI/SA1388 family protein